MLLRLYKESYAGLSREVWILALVMLVNRAGSMLMPFLTIIMTEGRGFTLQEAGYLLSAFGLGSVAGSWLGGKLTDKLGFYPVQLWSLVFSGIMFFVLIWPNSLITNLLGIFILSVITDSFRPANHAAVIIYSKPENLTRSFGLLRLAFNLGFTVGPAIAGLLMGVFGYVSIFFMSGSGYLISAAILWWLLPKPVVEKNASRSSNDEHSSPSASQTTNNSPWQDKTYLKFLFFNLLAATGFFQLISSIPAFWKTDLAFSEPKVGLLFSLNGLLIALLEMPLVFVLERRAAKGTFITLGAILFVLSYAMLIINLPPTLAALLYIFFISIGEMFYMPFAASYAGSRAPQDALGRYMGLHSMSWGIAIIVAPTGGLAIAEAFGFPTLWQSSMLLCGLAAWGIWRTLMHQHK